MKAAALAIIATRRLLPAIQSGPPAPAAAARRLLPAIQSGPPAPAAAAIESRGLCSRCGEPVLVTQERDQDGVTGEYFHTNPKNCPGTSAGPQLDLYTLEAPQAAAGASALVRSPPKAALKRHGSRNVVHPMGGETEA